jgi:hypothetical protein
MSSQEIAAALKDIRRERDPNLKSQKLASLVSALFRARGIELVVVGARELKLKSLFDPDRQAHRVERRAGLAPNASRELPARRATTNSSQEKLRRPSP